MSSVSYRDLTGSAAENYQRYFVPTIATAVSHALLHTADLRPGERVLDLACGTGVITRAAAERVGTTGTVTGVDLAPDMLEVARAVPVGDGAAPIEWRQADAAHLPLPDDAFDIGLCQMGLMFMDDQPGALRELCRVVKPGGRVVLNTPGPVHTVFATMEEALTTHIDPGLAGFVGVVFSLHDPDTVAELLRAAGWQRVEAGTAVATFRLPPPATFLWQYLSVTPLAPAVQRAPEAARAAMERDITARWQPYVVDGGLVVEQSMVVARGRR